MVWSRGWSISLKRAGCRKTTSNLSVAAAGKYNFQLFYSILTIILLISGSPLRSNHSHPVSTSALQLQLVNTHRTPNQRHLTAHNHQDKPGCLGAAPKRISKSFDTSKLLALDSHSSLDRAHSLATFDHTRICLSSGTHFAHVPQIRYRMEPPNLQRTAPTPPVRLVNMRRRRRVLSA